MEFLASSKYPNRASIFSFSETRAIFELTSDARRGVAATLPAGRHDQGDVAELRVQQQRPGVADVGGRPWHRARSGRHCHRRRGGLGGGASAGLSRYTGPPAARDLTERPALQPELVAQEPPALQPAAAADCALGCLSAAATLPHWRGLSPTRRPRGKGAGRGAGSGGGAVAVPPRTSRHAAPLPDGLTGQPNRRSGQ